MAFIFYSQSFARFLFIFLAEGDSLKSLLIAASKIVKSFQTFPDISTGIGRWYQSDHKHIGLSTASTQKRKCQKILFFRHFFKETD
ncbi:hypothetical protein DW919_12720 [Odoribacter splanchnicus]|nr:hypothetical protein DW919_12720 [Odoribacter splanchnicus]